LHAPRQVLVLLEGRRLARHLLHAQVVLDLVDIARAVLGGVAALVLLLLGVCTRPARSRPSGAHVCLLALGYEVVQAKHDEATAIGWQQQGVKFDSLIKCDS
jgi:hypothetical protein